MTKQAFIEAYKQELLTRYSWANNPDKLERFLTSVTNTLTPTQTPNPTWHHEGEAVTAAWKAIGGKGKPTLKALRALQP